MSDAPAMELTNRQVTLEELLELVRETERWRVYARLAEYLDKVWAEWPREDRPLWPEELRQVICKP